MLKFNSIPVAKVYPQTEYATTIEFEIPESLKDQYRFSQGQHLNCKVKINGKDVRRSYSLCNGPAENIWRITVKHVDDGVFSSYVKSELKPGQEIDVLVPTGRFFTELNQDQSKHYVAFAAGSGITPVLSNLRAILATEPNSSFTLFYGNRNLKSVLFREELQDLKNTYMNRLSVHYLLSQEHREPELFYGRLDGDRAKTLLDMFCGGVGNVDDFFICGPDTMIENLSTALESFGVSTDQIHTERFGVQRRRNGTASKQTVQLDEEPTAVVEVSMDGHVRSFNVYGDDNLLDAAVKSGLDLPYSCKAGVCSTCRTKLVEGEVAMDTNHALEPWELEQGYVLACQSRAKTDKLRLDYDA